MRKLSYAFILVVLTHWGSAQTTLQEFENFGDPFQERMFIGFTASFSNLSNPEAPVHVEAHRLSALVGKFDMKSMSAEVGSRRYFFQYKLLGDLISLLDKTVQNSNAIYRDENSTLSNGLLGWHSVAWNIVATPKLSFVIGGNANDYIIGSTYDTDTGRVTLEPQGYHLAAGPAIFTDYLINDYLLLQIHAAYSMSYLNAGDLSYATVDKEYPKPHFGSLNIELNSPWGVYAGFDYNWLINRGNLPGNTKRWDYLIGIRFMI